MSYSPRAVDLDGLRAEVDDLLADAPEGAPLTPMARALVEYAVATSVTTLDMPLARDRAGAALDAGATAGQLHEILALVSGLGVHTLMEGSRDLAGLLEERGEPLDDLDDERRELHERLIAPGGSFWDVFEQNVPGFLDALLRLSPVVFEGFVAYGALPARTRQVPAVVKEIASVALDALPNHRYLPGLRLHLGNALRFGAGRTEILEAVGIAAAAPEPPGIG